MYKSSARISLHLLPGFEFLKIKSVLYDTDNTPKNVPALHYGPPGGHTCHLLMSNLENNFFRNNNVSLLVEMISSQNYVECGYVNYVNRQVEQFSIGIILQPTVRLANFLTCFIR